MKTANLAKAQNTSGFWIVPVKSSVPDTNPNPDPDLPDPHVFGPSGTRYGSGSLYHQAKIVRKALILTGTVL